MINCNALLSLYLCHPGQRLANLEFPLSRFQLFQSELRNESNRIFALVGRRQWIRG